MTANSTSTQKWYLPFFYSERIKRPGKGHFRSFVLFDDIPILILSFSWVSPSPALHALSMAVLYLSFWCVYEIGYWENDRIAARYEANAVLSKSFGQFNIWGFQLQAWLWSSILALLGLTLLDLAQKTPAPLLPQLLVQYAEWIGLLLVTRVSFWAFNHTNKPTRIWIYPVLQLVKGFGFLAVTATNAAGVMFLLAQAIARWIPYLIYRCGGGRPNTEDYAAAFSPRIARLIVVCLLWAAIAIGEGNIAQLYNWQVLCILAWCLLRATSDLMATFREIKPIARS